MVCFECGETSFSFDERLGERICDSCGLVEITEIFEETVSYFNINGEVIRSRDGPLSLGTIHVGRDAFVPAHIHRGLATCNMILSSIAPRHPLSDRVTECYLSLYRAHKFSGIAYEIRACAIIFYVFHENGLHISMKDICKEFTTDIRRAGKLARNIAKHFGNSSVYARDNISSKLTEIARKVNDSPNFAIMCHEVHEFIKPILDDAHFTRGRTYCQSICCLTSALYCYDITVAQVAEKAGFSRNAISRQNLKILKYLGYNTLQDIRGKTIQGLSKNA